MFFESEQTKIAANDYVLEGSVINAFHHSCRQAGGCTNTNKHLMQAYSRDKHTPFQKTKQKSQCKTRMNYRPSVFILTEAVMQSIAKIPHSPVFMYDESKGPDD